jgi:hypothetical protein
MPKRMSALDYAQRANTATTKRWDTMKKYSEEEIKA